MKHWWILLPSTLLMACASHTPSPQALPEPSVTYLQQGDRTPASAPTIYWKKDIRSIEVNAGGGVYPIAFNVQKVMEWKEQQPYSDFEYQKRPYADPGVCEEYRCSGKVQGQSAQWDAFFKATTSAQKAKALADALQGIGEVSSQSLIKGGYFRHGITSWDNLVAEIDRAKDAKVITGSVAHAVKVRYKTENIASLGYQVNSCQKNTYSCIEYGERLEKVPVTKFREVTQQRVIEQMTRNFQLIVEGPILQNFEKDVININVGNEIADVTVSYNNVKTVYKTEVDVKDGVIKLTGVDRIKSNLPNSVLRGGDLYYKKGGTEAELTLTVEPSFIPVNDEKNRNDQLAMTYVVKRCKQNWFGFCKGDFVSEPAKFYNVTQSNFTIRIPIAVDERIQVDYMFGRVNSLYYNDKGTTLMNSDKVNRNR